jgi:hypothetical protein
MVKRPERLRYLNTDRSFDERAGTWRAFRRVRLMCDTAACARS